MQQNKNQELRNPTLLFLQDPLKTKFSTLRHNSKMANSSQVGRKLNSILYVTVNRPTATRKRDYHHSDLLKNGRNNY